MGKLEQLFGPVFRGPVLTKINSSPNQWAGRTTLSSGSISQVVSTTAVKSDCLVLFGVQATTIAASGVGKSVEVVSLSNGNYFTFGTVDGIAIQQSVTIMWQIVKSS